MRAWSGVRFFCGRGGDGGDGGDGWIGETVCLGTLTVLEGFWILAETIDLSGEGAK